MTDKEALPEFTIVTLFPGAPKSGYVIRNDKTGDNVNTPLSHPNIWEALAEASQLFRDGKCIRVRVDCTYIES